MMSHGYGMGAGWSVLLFVIVLPTLLIALGLLAGWLQRRPSVDPIPGAERLLAERFARGEIATEEYEVRVHALRAARCVHR